MIFAYITESEAFVIFFPFVFSQEEGKFFFFYDFFFFILWFVFLFYFLFALSFIIYMCV